ncbi:hypothetical protein MNBD_GAMMA07-2666 [hydrothermal vent metagenome]|uniref:Peptidase A2 domain-containing protein n=1 Tax=hydrothermal vent metagenome TaxID=652676 RepID=A0A3B0WNI1_9ZZZZ
MGWFFHEKQSLPTGDKTRAPSIVLGQNDVESVSPVEMVHDDNDLLQLLNILLMREKIEAAMTLYESLQQDSNFTKLDEATKAILVTAGKLISQQNYNQAKKLLNLYLLDFNRDVNARLLLVEADYRSANYLLAIDSLYLVKGHAYRAEDINKIIKKTRLIVNKQADIFKRNEQYTDLLALYEKLTQQEADYAPYFIGLAEAQILLGNFNAAKNYLQMLLGDVDVGHKASVMLAELQKKLPQPEVVEDAAEEEDAEITPGVALFKRGNSYLLDAYPNGNEAIRLLIDTGASITVLTPETLKKHNVKFKDTGEVRFFSTANGVVEAPIYTLDYLTIGEWRVDDINIAMLDMQNNGSSEGLLGMNFLQHFQFFIDQKNQLLHLSLR